MTYDELSFRFKHNKFANNYLRPVLRPIVRALIWPFVNKRRKKEKEARHSDFLHNGQDLLARFNSAMKNAGIDYWLDFGTLLGAYREHGLIKHDMDFDVGAFYADRKNIEKTLLDAGFRLIRQLEVVGRPELGFEQTYEYKGVPIDVFYYHIHADEATMHCNSFSCSANDYHLFQVKEITFPYTGFAKMKFLGETVSVPKDCVAHLKVPYGENFMTPDPHYDYRKTCKSLRWIPIEEYFGRKTINLD